MVEKNLTDAFETVLKDPKTIKFLADKTAKQILKNKANPSNDEDELVRKHVVFGQEESESATFMTAKEIRTAILEFDGDLHIRPRVFGKSLMDQVVVTKKSSLGQVYLIETIVEEITSDVLDKIETNKTTEAETEETEKTVNVPLLIKAVNGFENIKELEEHLKALSLKGLKKFIKNHEIPLSVEDETEESLVTLITDFIEDNLGNVETEESVEEEEISKEQVQEEVAEEVIPKKSKKDKKKKKKKKNIDLDKELEKEDLTDLKPKKEKKKKKKKTKK